LLPPLLLPLRLPLPLPLLPPLLPPPPLSPLPPRPPPLLPSFPLLPLLPLLLPPPLRLPRNSLPNHPTTQPLNHPTRGRNVDAVREASVPKLFAVAAGADHTRL